ncbi:iron chelate uptake ABC transporter family permease subunit [Brachybacterium sp. AOP43-C2-M15]|uniref:iron chelate uptake ABC transporter family permease subunit n=1 Tax=Brachybacterium sp. AOP43-C2-M15 TaxID=3457661 RepID=UPI0040333D53
MDRPAPSSPAGAPPSLVVPGVGAIGRTLIAAVLATLVAVLAVVLSLMLGAATIAPGEMIAALSGRGDPRTVLVVQELRVPRTVLALVAGAAVAGAGSVLQALGRSPVLDPGASGPVVLAALPCLLLSLVGGASGLRGTPLLLVLAVLGAALGVTALLLIARRLRSPAGRAALAGGGLALFGAGYLAWLAARRLDPGIADLGRHWGGLGGLDGTTAPSLWWILPLLSVGVVLLLVASVLLAMLGDGLPAVMIGVAGISVVVGTATVGIGSFAFVGLLAGALAAAAVGPGNLGRMLCALPLGAAVLLLSDLVGRLIAVPVEHPAGLVLLVVGLPVLGVLALLTVLRGPAFPCEGRAT